MGKTVVFANQKGGVGKTTTVVSLGAYIAQMGKKVLLVDFDPQGNLSSNVGVDKERPGIYEALTGQRETASVISKTTVDNLFCVPSNINLAGANIELIESKGREYFLKKALEGIEGQYDYIFIDCPPSLGILTINGLTAARKVIVPLQCEYFALEGLSLLLKTIRRVQKGPNPRLGMGGIVFTMYDSRTRLANEVVNEVKGYFKDKVFSTIIPRNIRLSEAPSHSVPISQYNAACQGAKSYEQLAKEVIQRV